MKHFAKTSILLSVLIILLAVSCISSLVLLCIKGVNISLFSKIENDDLISPNQLAQTFDYGNHYVSSIIFVADKSLSPMANKNGITKDQIWTGKSGSLPLDYNLATTSIIHSENQKGSSIADAAAIYKPQYMIIAVGLENGVGYCTEEKFKEYYIRLIKSIQESSPDTKIILQSILPVSRTAEKADPSMSNKRIDEANKYIISIAEQLGLKYLNTASALKDDNGRLNSNYDSGDGITLNEQGYKVLIQYIRTHGYK